VNNFAVYVKTKEKKKGKEKKIGYSPLSNVLSLSLLALSSPIELTILKGNVH
jgi:hypothetical protein